MSWCDNSHCVCDVTETVQLPGLEERSASRTAQRPPGPTQRGFRCRDPSFLATVSKVQVPRSQDDPRVEGGGSGSLVAGR